MAQIVPIEDRIKAREDLSEEEKSAAIRAIQELASEVYSEAFIQSFLSRAEAVDPREPSATKTDLANLTTELKTDIARLEGKVEALSKDLVWFKVVGGAIGVGVLIPLISAAIGLPIN